LFSWLAAVANSSPTNRLKLHRLFSGDCACGNLNEVCEKALVADPKRPDQLKKRAAPEAPKARTQSIALLAL
jgi:hypothetical protein